MPNNGKSFKAGLERPEPRSRMAGSTRRWKAPGPGAWETIRNTAFRRSEMQFIVAWRISPENHKHAAEASLAKGAPVQTD